MHDLRQHCCCVLACQSVCLHSPCVSWPGVDHTLFWFRQGAGIVWVWLLGCADEGLSCNQTSQLRMVCGYIIYLMVRPCEGSVSWFIRHAMAWLVTLATS